MGRATFQISPTMTGWVDAMINKSEFTYPGNPSGIDGITPVTCFNRSGVRQSFQLILPVGHPDNPNNFRIALRYRFAEIGRTEADVDYTNTRATAGLNGVFGAWDWETAVLYSASKREEDTNSQLYAPLLRQVVADGSFHFYPNTQKALAPGRRVRVFGEVREGHFGLEATRELFPMKGGMAAVATGIELRKEKMDIVSDPRTVNGDIVGLASSTVSGDRNISTIYAEFSRCRSSRT
jgi:iron complex outermembrane receptor protein